MDSQELARLWPYLTPAEREEITKLSQPRQLWEPLPGPQLTAYLSDADELFYGGAGGGGKALSLDTHLSTPAGWTTMGQVRVGDTLFDERGQPCTVISTSPVMVDREVYEVVFDDGSSIKADAEHKWLTFTQAERDGTHKHTEEYRARRRNARPSRGTGKRPDLAERNRRMPPPIIPPPCGVVRTTLQVLASLRGDRKEARANHSVAVASPLQLPESILPLDPYVLGAWLGDGTSMGQGFTSADVAVVDCIRAMGYEVRKWRDVNGWGIRKIKGSLRGLGLLGDKHIPPMYLRASEAQRLALLQGLMDTDGTATIDGGACEFYSCNKNLAKDALELILSLGFKASIGTGRAVLYGKDCGEKYRIKFSTARPVFRLPRKLERQITRERGTQRWHYIVDVRPIPSEPVRCIAVDSPSHLYLAGRAMIPTHNTDLLLGLAATRHRRSILFRRVSPELRGIVERSREIYGLAGRFNEQMHLWRLSDGRQIEFGYIQFEKDKEAHRGRPHDFYGWDEVTEFTESMFRFVNGWNRTTRKGQRCRIVAASNPPASAEGEWVMRYWGPWLDSHHSNPARPGELRWFATMNGKDEEVESGEPFEREGEMILPRSRTFIPALLKDNPFLMQTGYMAVLQSLPEPLRSQMLYGDFTVGVQDDPWQVIPTEWVRAAQRRWTPDGMPRDENRIPLPQTAVGVDVARGGKDATVLARRYGNWFAPLEKYPGSATPDGPTVAGLVLAALVQGGYANVDAIGVGASVYDFCRQKSADVNSIIFSAASSATDKSGKLTFANLRAEAYWRFREALDPNTGDGIALPPDPELLADLCAPKWMMRIRGVQVEDKEEIIKRLGRSPDCGDAVVLAAMAGRALPFGWMAAPAPKQTPWRG